MAYYKKPQLVKALRSPNTDIVIVQKLDEENTLISDAYFVMSILTQDLAEVLIKAGIPLPPEASETTTEPHYEYNKAQRRWRSDGPDARRLWQRSFDEEHKLNDTNFFFLDRRSQGRKLELYRLLAHVTDSGKVEYYGLHQIIIDVFEDLNYELVIGGGFKTLRVSTPAGVCLALIAPAILQSEQTRWLIHTSND